MRFEGRLSEWRDSQGYGFIAPDSGGPRVFVHIRDIADRTTRPKGDERVSFLLGKDARGRPRAEAVELLDKRVVGPRGNSPSVALMGVAVLFVASLAGLASVNELPESIVYLYLGMSAATFVVYAVDKSAASDGRWRTPETTLHALSLFGGWPGALVAQQILRHKSRKRAFQLVFWLCTVLNVVALGIASSPSARAGLANLLPG